MCRFSSLGLDAGVPGVDLEQFRLERIRAVSGLPRFDAPGLCGILCGGLPCREIRSRVIRRGAAHISVGFQSLRLGFFLAPRQLFQLVDRLLCGRPGGSLDTVDLGVLPLSALGGVPELTLQLLRSGEKAALKEFLRHGLDFFFCDF